jgi:DNA-binding response OmpR family regulator
MQGDQALPEMRHLPDYQETPIVVFSAAAKEREEWHCRQLGATAYVQKSSNFYVYFASLKAIVHTWLRHHSASSGALTHSADKDEVAVHGDLSEKTELCKV